MRIFFHRNFEKQFGKMSPKVRQQFRRRLVLFAENPFHPHLHDHALKGKFDGYRSINVTGDIRAVYKRLLVEDVEFDAIGSHGELYG